MAVRDYTDYTASCRAPADKLMQSVDHLRGRGVATSSILLGVQGPWKYNNATSECGR